MNDIFLRGNASAVHIESLFNLQKKAIKIIRSVPIRYPSNELFKEVNLLMLSQIYSLLCLSFIFKFLKDSLPDIFCGFFVQNKHIASRITRQEDMLHIPRHRTCLYGNTIKINGAKLWNTNCANFNRQCSIHFFKRKLKQKFID